MYQFICLVLEMNTATIPATKQEDKIRPLWKYFLEVRKVPSSGNFEIKCNLCELAFNASYTKKSLNNKS